MPTKTIVGNIPKNITYISGATKKLECFWEDESLRSGWNGQEVIPAFCSDSDNNKTLETGISWARNTFRYDDKKGEVKTLNLKNDPISGIKIVSLEHRGNGGRAYKVVTPENFYFDVREDILMDTMTEAGVSKGGILNGKFIWAKVGSEMKLVRVGSTLHKALLVATQDRSLKKIKYGDLQVGHIYKGKSAEQWVFLGYVDYNKCNLEPDLTRYGWQQRYQHPILSRTEVFNGLLLWSYEEHRFKNNKFDENIYYCNVKTSHSFIKDCGTVEVSDIIMETIRNKADAYMIEKEIEEEKRQQQFSVHTDKSDREYSKLDRFSYVSPLLTMRAACSTIVLPEQYQTLLDKFPLTETIKKKI